MEFSFDVPMLLITVQGAASHPVAVAAGRLTHGRRFLVAKQPAKSITVLLSHGSRAGDNNVPVIIAKRRQTTFRKCCMQAGIEVCEGRGPDS